MAYRIFTIHPVFVNGREGYTRLLQTKDWVDTHNDTPMLIDAVYMHEHTLMVTVDEKQTYIPRRNIVCYHFTP